MGILDRINEDQDRRLMDASSAELEQERTRNEQHAQLRDIIHDDVRKLAARLDEEFEQLVPGVIFRIGDIILCVELFQKHKPLPDPNSTTTRLILMEYLVQLLYVDKRDQQLDRLRIGTLKFVDYDSLYRVVTGARSYMDLRAEAVLALSDQFERFK